MRDDAVEVFMAAGGVIEIDAAKIGVIIFEACHTSETNAGKAANKIVEYLIDAFNDAKMRAQQ